MTRQTPPPTSRSSEAVSAERWLSEGSVRERLRVRDPIDQTRRAYLDIGEVERRGEARGAAVLPLREVGPGGVVVAHLDRSAVVLLDPVEPERDVPVPGVVEGLSNADPLPAPGREPRHRVTHDRVDLTRGVHPVVVSREELKAPVRLLHEERRRLAG